MRRLKSVTIPAGVTDIGSAPFGRCASLASITVAEGNTAYKITDGLLLSMDGRTLVGCPGAIEGDVTIPDGVTTIGGGAFLCCVKMTSVNIPSSVTIIEKTRLIHALAWLISRFQTV